MHVDRLLNFVEFHSDAVHGRESELERHLKDDKIGAKRHTLTEDDFLASVGRSTTQ